MTLYDVIANIGATRFLPLVMAKHLLPAGQHPVAANDGHGPLCNCPFCEHGLGPSAA